VEKEKVIISMSSNARPGWRRRTDRKRATIALIKGKNLENWGNRRISVRGHARGPRVLLEGYLKIRGDDGSAAGVEKKGSNYYSSDHNDGKGWGKMDRKWREGVVRYGAEWQRKSSRQALTRK